MFDVKCMLFLTVLILTSSESVERKLKDWYETTTIYQIYPRSFKDSNGDGIGDLKGIHEKLDYIQDIGFQTLWIQSFFQSPMVDFGYDISDYRKVEPIFGTLDDLKKLVDAIHDKGMKVMIDFIPNHTSNEHEWFTKSVNREEPYTDFYVWRDPKGFDQDTKRPLPPNNWFSIFGGSAWQWNEKRQQFHYRFFTAAQPDLNYRNPKLRAAMEVQYPCQTHPIRGLGIFMDAEDQLGEKEMSILNKLLLTSFRVLEKFNCSIGTKLYVTQTQRSADPNYRTKGSLAHFPQEY